MIVLGRSREDLEPTCTELRQAGTVHCADCMPLEDGVPVWIGYGLRKPLLEVWDGLRMYL